MEKQGIWQSCKSSCSQLIEWIMLSRRNAVIAAVICAALPVFSWFSGAIVALVTLRQDEREGLSVMLWAMVPSLILAVFLKAPSLFLQNVIVGFLPIWLFAFILRRTHSWSVLLQLGTLLTIACVTAFHLYVGDTIAFWTAHLLPVQDKILANPPTNMQASEVKALFHAFIITMTSNIAIIILLNSLCVVLFARWVQSRMYNPGGLVKELLAITVSWYALLCLALIVGLSIAKYQLATDLLFVSFTPFIGAGLSILHTYFRKQQTHYFWVLLFYCIFSILAPIVAGLLAVLAIADRAYDFRQLTKSSY